MQGLREESSWKKLIVDNYEVDLASWKTTYTSLPKAAASSWEFRRDILFARFDLYLREWTLKTDLNRVILAGVYKILKMASGNSPSTEVPSSELWGKLWSTLEEEGTSNEETVLLHEARSLFQDWTVPENKDDGLLGKPASITL